MAKKRIEVTDVNYNQKHLVEVEESDLPKPTAEELLSKMEGDTEEAGVNVDLSADGKKVKITLDQDVKDAISGNNTIEVQFTEDDWDEEEQAYVKHLEINNCYFNMFVISAPIHENPDYKIYCPYFKGLSYFNTEEYSNLIFAGLSNQPEDRFISFNDDIALSVFNGLLGIIYTDF